MVKAWRELVTIPTYEIGKAEKNPIFLEKRVYQGSSGVVYPYPVVAYPSFDTTAVWNGYRAGNPIAAKAISELTAFQPDIIHSHCPSTATVVARLIREQTGAPIIFTYHTKYDIDIRGVARVIILSRPVLLHRMDCAADIAYQILRLIKACQKKREKNSVITKCQSSCLSVVLLEIHAHSAVIGAVQIELADLKILFADDYISEHIGLLTISYL